MDLLYILEIIYLPCGRYFYIVEAKYPLYIVKDLDLRCEIYGPIVHRGR